MHDEADADWLTRPAVRRGLAAVFERGLAYDLLVRSRELPAATAVARDFPHPVADPQERRPWDRRLGLDAAARKPVGKEFSPVDTARHLAIERHLRRARPVAAVDWREMNNWSAGFQPALHLPRNSGLEGRSPRFLR